MNNMLSSGYKRKGVNRSFKFRFSEKKQNVPNFGTQALKTVSRHYINRIAR